MSSLPSEGSIPEQPYTTTNEGKISETNKHKYQQKRVEL